MKIIERIEPNIYRTRCKHCQSLLEVSTSDFNINRVNYVNHLLEIKITGYSNNSLLEYYFTCPVCIRNNYITEESLHIPKYFMDKLYLEKEEEIRIKQEVCEKYLDEYKKELEDDKKKINSLLKQMEMTIDISRNDYR